MRISTRYPNASDSACIPDVPNVRPGRFQARMISRTRDRQTAHVVAVDRVGGRSPRVGITVVDAVGEGDPVAV